MIVHLAQMIGEMDGEVEQEVPGRELHSAHRLRIGFRQVLVAQAAHRLGDRGKGGVDLPEQLRPRSVAPAELGLAVAHVPRSAEYGADEVQEITCQMEGQVAGRVGNPRCYPPQIPVLGKRFDFASQRPEVACENRAEPGGHHKRRT